MKHDIFTIGITGTVGSGKTLACEILENNYNVYTFYTDDIAKIIINSNDAFAWLRSKKYQILTNEEIYIIKNDLHPLVWKYIENEINNTDTKYDYILIETALPNDDFFNLCDKEIYIYNNIEKKRLLLQEKRNYNNNIINAILNTQEEYKTYYDKCEYCIENNNDKIDFEKKLLDVVKNIKL